MWLISRFAGAPVEAVTVKAWDCHILFWNLGVYSLFSPLFTCNKHCVYLRETSHIKNLQNLPVEVTIWRTAYSAVQQSPLGQMGWKRDKLRWERVNGRSVEKCVSEHWVTLLLKLSTSKVSPQGWGLRWMGTRGGERESLSGGERRKAARRVQAQVRTWKQTIRNYLWRWKSQVSNVRFLYWSLGAEKQMKYLSCKLRLLLIYATFGEQGQDNNGVQSVCPWCWLRMNPWSDILVLHAISAPKLLKTEVKMIKFLIISYEKHFCMCRSQI